MAIGKAEIAAQLVGALRQHSRVQDRDALAIAALLSALLHLVLLNWLVVRLQAPAADPPVPETEITLVSRSDIDSTKPPAAESAPQVQTRAPPADAPSPVEPPQARGDAWTQSRIILSSQELAEPRNRKTVETLKLLEPHTRSEQMCDFEAILQINRQFNQYAVDFVIAYATQAAVRKGDAIIAHGAAFHSNGRWYNLAFECQLSANQRDVAHLKFRLGEAIPGDQWADLNLPKAPANPLGGD